jgi:hypothetical protein
MSSAPDHGIAAVAASAVAAGREMVAALSRDGEQANLFDDPTPEDMVVARETLGEGASARQVLDHARTARRGRPAGARNKRTDDFARYILGFGEHPAITMMKIKDTPPEMLIEASRRTVRRIDKSGRVVDIDESMSYEAAQSLRARCAAELLPYVEGKRPLAVDMRVQVDGTLSIPGVTDEALLAANVIDGDWQDVDVGDEPDFGGAE